MQNTEYVKGESARLLEQLALREAQDLSKTIFISATTALQGEVVSLQMRLNTAFIADATAMKAKTAASRQISAASYADHTAISAAHTPASCIMPEAPTN